MDIAMEINEIKCVLYQVAGIMALAAEAIRDSPSQAQIEPAWAALDGGHTLLIGTIEKELSSVMDKAGRLERLERQEGSG
ncbi:MAG: hypothetical protein M3N97_04890 [Pseudomonadota bacterium]|nr:hypothetical protein [Pseudomonadota bacterium]